MKLTAFTLFTAVSLSLAMERVSIDGFGAFGDAEEEDEEEQLSDQEQEAAETLAGQLADQIKGQIKDQMRASKLGRSRIAQTDELTLATANNQYERVEKLLAGGANPDGPPEARSAPLHAAAEQGLKDVADLLLWYNASVDRLTEIGTPLCVAAAKGRTAVTELLLRHGADVNMATPYHQKTPLHFASEMGHAHIVSKLLEANASTFARADDGSGALHLAAREGHEGVVRKLLDAGAPVDEHDNEGARPSHLACAFGHDAVLQMMREAGAAPVAEDDDIVARVRQRPMLKVEMRSYTFTSRGAVDRGAVEEMAREMI